MHEDTTPKEKTFEEYVAEQAADMVAELKAHEAEFGGPGDWLKGEPESWLDALRDQVDNLENAIDVGSPAAEVKKRAAHVCNFAMMAAQTELAQR